MVVIENQARLDTTVWGDLLTSMAVRKNLAGTVIDGICRDVDRALELNYPIFCRGNWMRIGKDRVRVEAIQEPASTICCNSCIVIAFAFMESWGSRSFKDLSNTGFVSRTNSINVG